MTLGWRSFFLLGWPLSRLDIDAKLFLVLAEKTREGIKTTAEGRPCDKHFSDAMNSPEVNHFLQPMPGGNEKKREIADVNGSENVEKVKKGQRVQGMEAFCAQGSFGHGLCGCYQQRQFTMFRLSTGEVFVAGFETEML